ncbi:MAG: MipA/OmpV family protein [Burkholderiaceae bacterium]|nr:MipA/OmpV family protein [Burkholderiaceae bacterium]
MALMGAVHGVGASEPVAPTSDGAVLPAFHYALGAIVSNGPDGEGSAGRKTSLRPSWAIEYGHFRVSSSRGSAFLGHGFRTVESGASATLAENDRFNLRAGLRVDRGENVGDDVRLVGLPAVRSTLRARLSAGYAVTPRWSLGAGVSQDILGRSGGARLSTTVAYSWPITAQTNINFDAGAHFGSRTYLNSNFGVPSGSASTLPVFSPGAGLYSVDGGVEVMSALNRHWVILGAARVSQLQGDARRSPRTVEPVGYSLSVGLAYRCCK